jgi:hypothetical protein
VTRQRRPVDVSLVSILLMLAVLPARPAPGSETAGEERCAMQQGRHSPAGGDGEDFTWCVAADWRTGRWPGTAQPEARP